MAVVYVGSLYENSILFPLYLDGQEREFIKDTFNKVVSVYEKPVIKNVYIEGVHSYEAKPNKGNIGYAITAIDKDDWEQIKVKYANHYCIKNKLIFSAKSEMELIAIARDAQARQYATLVKKWDGLSRIGAGKTLNREHQPQISQIVA